jgi:hypothetical protein
MDAAMNRVLTGLMLAALVSLSGCDDAPNRGTVDEAPKVEVDTDPDADLDGDQKSGLSIKLPGVEINVDEDKGVDVKAPGTDVNVNRDGVDITAPNVRIRTAPQEDN